jgi:hypothetical protein
MPAPNEVRIYAAAPQTPRRMNPELNEAGSGKTAPFGI